MTENGRDRVIYDICAHPSDDEWQRRRSPFWERGSVARELIAAIV
jgi:hypothetical protein